MDKAERILLVWDREPPRFFRWLLMQGDAIVIIGPEPFRQAFIQTLQKIQNAYTDSKEDCPT